MKTDRLCLLKAGRAYKGEMLRVLIKIAFAFIRCLKVHSIYDTSQANEVGLLVPFYL